MSCAPKIFELFWKWEISCRDNKYRYDRIMNFYFGNLLQHTFCSHKEAIQFYKLSHQFSISSLSFAGSCRNFHTSIEICRYFYKIHIFFSKHHNQINIWVIMRFLNEPKILFLPFNAFFTIGSLSQDISRWNKCFDYRPWQDAAELFNVFWLPKSKSKLLSKCISNQIISHVISD